MNTNPLEHLSELSRRVDEKFAEIRARFPGQFRCGEGCHSCCKPGLTVNLLEADRIRAHLEAAPPSLTSSLLETERNRPFGQKRCAFLQPEGGCGIYEVRPLVCRSHGAPLQYTSPDNAEMKLRDVCPLNFSDGTGVAELPADAILNLDTINTLLAVLSKQAHGRKLERIPLQPSSFV